MLMNAYTHNSEHTQIFVILICDCVCYLLYIIFASDSVDIFFLFRYSFHNDFFAMHIM